MSQSLHFAAGQIIFRQDDVSDFAYIIRKGRVEISREEAGAVTPLAILKPGEMFGEYGLLDNAPRSATAKALEEVELQIMEL